MQLLDKGVTDAEFIRYGSAAEPFENVLLIEPAPTESSINLYCYNAEVFGKRGLKAKKLNIATPVALCNCRATLIPNFDVKANLLTFDGIEQIE